MTDLAARFLLSREGFWQRGPMLRGLVTAFAAALIAMLGRGVLQPLLGDALPFILAFPAIVYVSLRHGAGPAMLSIAVCAVWVAFPRLPPNVSAEHLSSQLGAFALGGVLTALIAARFSATMESSSELAEAGDTTPLSRWLRGVVWGAALLPLLAFGIACGWGYQRAFKEGHATALRFNRIVVHQAENTFAVAQDVIDRVQRLADLPDAELRAGEASYHARLSDMKVGLPAVFGISVIDRDGRALVSSQRHPVDPTVQVADRAYFQQHRAEALPRFRVTGLVEGRQTGRQSFSLTARRLGPNGEFNGVIVVSLLPQYFQKFYESLAVQEPGRNTFLLVLPDGALITRWPPPAEGSVRMPAANALVPALQVGPASGVVSLTSSFDGVRRLVSYQRVGTLPLYVTAGLSEDTILEDWYRFVWLLSAVLLPTTALLVYVSWLALQRTRRHEAVWSRLQGEMQRRLQAEGALLHAQKLEALGQLTGGVAHDFNNLLGIVSNNVYLLKHVTKEPAAAGPLAAIGRATKSGVKLTRQLLSFARKQALKPETLRLQEWLPATHGLLSTTLGSRIDLTIDVTPDTAPVHIDPSELELALINLAVNAKHALDNRGRVHIEASNLESAHAGEPQPGVRISFTDSGSGIPPEVIARVFEPFFTTKGPGVGSGLGLSQVYGLCQQAGGTARIESQAGQGTTVSLLFPAQPSLAAVPTQEDVEVASRLHGTVLLVEDNDELAAAQELLLRTAGLDVERVSRADRAASLAESDSSPYDVVLSDVMMPGPFDGIALAFRLRASRPSLPVILLTGYAEQIETASNAGFVVLGKPVEPAVLFREMSRALERRSVPPT